MKTKATKENLAELREICRGRSGRLDGETAISWDHDGCQVVVFSTRPATIGEVIDRCAPAIRWWHGDVENGFSVGVSMQLDTGRNVARSAAALFTGCDWGNTAKREWQGGGADARTT